MLKFQVINNNIRKKAHKIVFLYQKTNMKEMKKNNEILQFTRMRNRINTNHKLELRIGDTVEIRLTRI